MIRVAINGFGRIGRRFFRLALQHPTIKVVAINDLATSKTLSHLLKYDSIHGVLDAEVSYDEDHIMINGEATKFLNYPSPKDFHANLQAIDVVIESSGKFKTKKELRPYIDRGVKHVILTVPPVDNDIDMVVLGVKEDALISNQNIISNASCTTNNAAPMLNIMDQHFGIEQAYITTIHSYTTDQSLHDQPHPDLRRARAAGHSIVPTTTGAAKALTKIFPHLSQVIGGCGIRVPVANGSLTDITLNIKAKTDIKDINQIFKKTSENQLRGILQYTEDPIVSIDILGNPHSCIFDAQMTSVIGSMVKIVGWYDNETGYSSRLIDVILKLKI